MTYLLCYTKKNDIFSKLVDRPKNMSGHLYFTDVYEAMHLALSRDGEHFTPLRNNTGILFPRATFSEGKPEGTTKTLRDPWLFDRADGTYGVCGVRRNEDGPDPLSIGCMMLFSSKDLIRYEETGFLKVADEEITSPRCRYEEAAGEYYLEFGTSQGIFRAYTADFSGVHGVEKIPAYTLKNAAEENPAYTLKNAAEENPAYTLKNAAEENPAYTLENAAGKPSANTLENAAGKPSAGTLENAVGKVPADTLKNAAEKVPTDTLEKESPAGNREGMEDILCGNILEISEETAEKLEKYLGVIRHVSVDPVVLEVHVRSETDGTKPALRKENLPRAVCRYSDGSVHEKPVDWDEAALRAIDFTKPGIYEVPGRIRQKHWPFPMMKEKISDPCITRYQGKYYLSATGMRDVSFRISDTIEGCFKAKRTVVWSLPKGDRKHANIWAQELHIIHGVPYVFTTVGSPEWYTVRSHVLRCVGDIADPKAWEEPRLCVKPDGTPLEEHGISLDMTYFCVGNLHYVMWSNRVVYVNKQKVVCEPADIFIATIDPDAPWQLASDPVRILRPQYGWDRLNTEVDEGPYLLRRGDDLFVTISGSSTGVADLYCLGLLHARAGTDLLRPESWEWLPYPILTKESVPGEFGPGHNNFVKDEETGDDLMVYHAVPHDKNGKSFGRHAGIRRVHWAANGYPYLEMTEERDLDPALRDIRMRVRNH